MSTPSAPSIVIATGNTLYLGRTAASIQSYSDGTHIAVFPQKTTITVAKTPVNPLDAVNKQYVDGVISTIAQIDASGISNMSSLLSAYATSDIGSFINLSSALFVPLFLVPASGRIVISSSFKDAIISGLEPVITKSLNLK